MNQKEDEPDEDLETDGMSTLSWNSLDCLGQKVQEEQEVGGKISSE
jgi:hypothetical protein